jgi:hypothetical protein
MRRVDGKTPVFPVFQNMRPYPNRSCPKRPMIHHLSVDQFSCLQTPAVNLIHLHSPPRGVVTPVALKGSQFNLLLQKLEKTYFSCRAGVVTLNAIFARACSALPIQVFSTSVASRAATEAFTSNANNLYAVSSAHFLSKPRALTSTRSGQVSRCCYPIVRLHDQSGRLGSGIQLPRNRHGRTVFLLRAKVIIHDSSPHSVASCAGHHLADEAVF